MARMISYVTRLMMLILICASIWAGGFLWFLSNIPKTLAEPDTATDAIIVLTGGSQRLDEAIWLLHQQKAKTLFISGVGKGADVTNMLILLGSLPDDIATYVPHIELGYEAENTQGNAIEVANWVTKNNIHSVRLVTANYHIPRSLLELKAQLPDIKIIPHPVFPDHVKLHDWWEYDGTRQLLLLEYHKYLLSHLRLFVFIQ